MIRVDSTIQADMPMLADDPDAIHGLLTLLLGVFLDLWLERLEIYSDLAE